MEGKWLEALGFHIGDALTVEYEEGSIRITSAAPECIPAMVAEPVQKYGTGKQKHRRTDS